MNSQNETHFSNFTLQPIETGRFLLDGGAMFGVVPKTLWSRYILPDEQNRIPMAMRSLLIKSNTSNRLYLVDTGSGDKFNEKMQSILGLDYNHSNLTDSLNSANVTPGQITDIIFTHLHFDHCGGTTSYNAQNELIENFPNATYHVHKKHWETALQPNSREKASFYEENIEPIRNSGRLNLTDDQFQFEENLKTMVVNGHTAGQQLPVLTSENDTIVFIADLIPTYAHVPLPWIMGYDMQPLITLKEKEKFLSEAAEKQYYVFMQHDAKNEVITIKKENGKYKADQLLTLTKLCKARKSG